MACNHTGQFPRLITITPLLSITLKFWVGGSIIITMPTKKIYMWIIKEMGRWRYIGKFNNEQQYQNFRKRENFVLSCPSQLRIVEDEQHFQKTLKSLREPEWDHHKRLKKMLTL